MSRPCQHCGLPAQVATRLSIHGMYDMFLFHPIEGDSVDGLLAAWEEHNSKPQPAYVGGDFVEDMGKSWFCPVIVLDAEDKEMRRVGEGIFERRGDDAKYDAEKIAFRTALLADPDIPRLLALNSGVPNGAATEATKP